MKENNEQIDILLTILPPWGTAMPPLGLAYLASYLKNKGFVVEVLDLNIKLYHAVDHYYQTLWHSMENFKFWTEEDCLHAFRDRFANLIEDYIHYFNHSRAKYIGFSVNAANQLLTIFFVKEMRRRGCSKRIIFGGPSCFQDFRNPVFHETADIFIVGEGEEALAEILCRMNQGERIENLPGVIVYKEESFRNFVKREVVKSLAEIGFPSFEEFDLSEYTERMLPLMLGRGCICKCTFCNDHYFLGSYRKKKAEDILKAVKSYVEKYNINRFFFSDLLINADINELQKLCDLIIADNLNIHWEGQALIRKEMKRSLLDKMKKAGCYSIAYGVESFSDKILNKMRKTFTGGEIDNVLKATHEAGIFTKIGIIIGFPGETEEDFRLTLAGVERNKANIDMISNIAPCLINEHSDLKDNSELYEICFSESLDRYFDWSDKSGNTYRFRKERVKEALVFFDKINLKKSLVNIYDDAFEKKRKEILPG